MCDMTDLLTDPCVPHWVKQIAREAINRDPVDAANWLETLARLFDDHANAVANNPNAAAGRNED